jgi:NADH oxidase (H2O2-forming)
MKIVVIGNGIAGYTAAETVKLSRPEASVAILSEENEPLYSPCIFGHYLAGDIKKEQLFLKRRDDYQDIGLETFFGQKVNRIDPKEKVVHLNNQSLAYDKLILATGSFPVIPPMVDPQDPRITPIKSINDIDRIETCLAGSQSKNVVVVGSGPVGLETAVSLHRQGHSVTVIELLEKVMPRLLDDYPASLLKNYLNEIGVRTLTGERVTNVIGDQDRLVVNTDKQNINCDFVCLSIGMRPRVEIAKDAGLELGSSGGIKVDPYMLTSNPNIYACGDCIETDEMLTGKKCLSLLWHTAKWQATVAAKNCLGLQARYPGSLNFTVLKVFQKWVVTSGNISSDFLECDPEVKEIIKPQDYLSVIRAHGKLVAFQFFGTRVPKELGRLLGTLRKRLDQDHWKEMTELYAPPHYQIGLLRSMWS